MRNVPVDTTGVAVLGPNVPSDAADLYAVLGGSNEITHTLIYGDTGAGKSSGAATWPTPMLVCFFDPWAKERPYIVDPRTRQPRGQQAAVMTNDGIPVQVVHVPGDPGALLYRIEHFNDTQARKPAAFARFYERLTTLSEDVWAWGIKTVVVDSVTFMELASRKQHQYVLNPTARDPRQWFGGATDALEEILITQLGALPINVVVVAHVDDDRVDVHGASIRVPAAPGRLTRRRELPSAFSELYRAYPMPGEKGQELYVWQTRSDGEFIAASQVGAPNPCPQDYRALWLRAG